MQLAFAVLALCAACSDSNGGTGNEPNPVPDAAVSDAAHAQDSAVADTSTTDAAAADAPVDASDASDAAPAPTCGDPPARYTLLTGADDGLAKDNVTNLVWMRESHGAGEPPQTQDLATTYCKGRGMRLPTKDEALALAAAYAPCAFGHWGTWTSTAAAVDGDAWVVDYTGGASPQVANNFPSAVLCVRDPK